MGKDFSNSGDFTMGDGNRSILWNSRTRQLEGDQELIAQIREELNGKQQTIMDVGTIWMDEKEPVAVTFVGSNLGLEYGPEAPKYGMLNEVECPGCEQFIEYFGRYPNYLCSDCVGKLVTAAEAPVRFFNIGPLGTGLEARLFNPATGQFDIEDPESSRTGHCYLYGALCIAEEARFGGVVVQLADPASPKG